MEILAIEPIMTLGTITGIDNREIYNISGAPLEEIEK